MIDVKARADEIDDAFRAEFEAELEDDGKPNKMLDLAIRLCNQDLLSTVLKDDNTNWELKVLHRSAAPKQAGVLSALVRVRRLEYVLVMAPDGDTHRSIIMRYGDQESLTSLSWMVHRFIKHLVAVTLKYRVAGRYEH